MRFFGVGEYGENHGRPHYHVILFGKLFTQDEIKACWPYGFVQADELTRGRAIYCAGYVVKKLTKPDDPRLCGRHPEFARMSLKRGLGYGALPALLLARGRAGGAIEQLDADDLGGTFRMLGKKYPLGRYLTHHARKLLGTKLSKEERLNAQKFQYQVGRLSITKRGAAKRKREQHNQRAEGLAKRKGVL